MNTENTETNVLNLTPDTAPVAPAPVATAPVATAPVATAPVATAPADVTETLPATLPAVPAQGKTRGRPKGSFTLVNVTLAELAAKFSDPQQQIPVSAKFIANLRLAVAAKSGSSATLTEAATPQPTIAIAAGV